MSNSNLTSIRRALENVEAGLENAGAGRAAVIFAQDFGSDEIYCLNTFEEVANMYPFAFNGDPRNIANCPKVFYFAGNEGRLYEITGVDLTLCWTEGENRIISFCYYSLKRTANSIIMFQENGAIDEFEADEHDPI